MCFFQRKHYVIVYLYIIVATTGYFRRASCFQYTFDTDYYNNLPKSNYDDDNPNPWLFDMPENNNKPKNNQAPVNSNGLGNQQISSVGLQQQAPNSFGQQQGPNHFGQQQAPNSFGQQQGPNHLGQHQGPNHLGQHQGPNHLGQQQSPNHLGQHQGPNHFGQQQASNQFGQQPMPNHFGQPPHNFGQHQVQNNFEQQKTVHSNTEQPQMTHLLNNIGLQQTHSNNHGQEQALNQFGRQQAHNVHQNQFRVQQQVHDEFGQQRTNKKEQQQVHNSFTQIKGNQEQRQVHNSLAKVGNDLEQRQVHNGQQQGNNNNFRQQMHLIPGQQQGRDRFGQSRHPQGPNPHQGWTNPVPEITTTKVRDFFMEPVNNQNSQASSNGKITEENANYMHFGNTQHLDGPVRKPNKTKSNELNPWLSINYDNTPEWAKNPKPHNHRHHGPPEPPRKTVWEMEEEELKKKKEAHQKVLQKYEQFVPPQIKHEPPKYMVPNGMRGPNPMSHNAFHPPPQNNRRSQTREQMVKQGDFEEVPKDFYKGKIVYDDPPKEPGKEKKSQKKERVKSSRRSKDPPADITGENWLENELKNSSVQNELFSAFIVFTILLIITHATRI